VGGGGGGWETDYDLRTQFKAGVLFGNVPGGTKLNLNYVPESNGGFVNVSSRLF
jgi:hypothetical protein